MEQITLLKDISRDVLAGLCSTPKHLSSKYLYDNRGSKIFKEIMHMPEYYLTDCELEIFQSYKQDIYLDFVSSTGKFELVELGAGDGLKTKILLTHFLNQNARFTYTPIDISEAALRNLTTDINNKLPDISVNGLVGDYFQLIEEINNCGRTKKILLFLGSNIGNFNKTETLIFLNKLKDVMHTNDLLFIGFDLKKDPQLILNAYNDAQGLTADFNLNLLTRINNELSANFDLQSFKHHEVYNPQSGSTKSYLISQKDQEVKIQKLNKTFHFKKWESIFMERSQKYDLNTIQSLAEQSGFEIIKNYYDKQQYFANSLWKIMS